MTLEAGQRFGPYELVQRLGRGGMAEVWLARRADGLIRREVALKVPAGGPGRSVPDARFDREREILAGLEHPHIARLYDAGFSADGHPFLALEYVPGRDLLAWSEWRQLDTSARLACFQQVLEAVRFAHARGVLHGDIKPSNIQVDERGEVRLLDFGVARLLDPETGDAAASPFLALTPGYASPEQERGGPLGPASDVFSLGVVLHQLLTGRLPSATLSGDAARSGASIPGMGASAQGAGAEGAGRRLLRSETDAICRRALAADPARRYADAGAFAEDLFALRNGRPVAAVQGGPGYRLRKWGVRHRNAVVAGGAALALSLLMAWVMVRTAPAPGAGSGAGQAIAVLPLEDLSEHHDQQYFSDGLTEDLIQGLVRVPGLRVAGRSSSFRLRDPHGELRNIAADLGVNYLLEGSVRRAGGRLRVNVSLLRVDSGFAVWSARYERPLSEVFQLQDEIAGAVAGVLQLRMAPAQATAARHRPSNTDAYAHFLIGRQLYDRASDAAAYREAIENFRQALAIDPGYAAAYAGLAAARAYLTDLEGESREGIAEAMGYAEKAQGLDDHLADGYSVRGLIRAVWLWNWNGAREDLEHALALEPSDSRTQHRYALLLASLGRMDEAIATERRALAEDPLDASAWVDLARCLIFVGQGAAADEALQRARQIQPGEESFLFNLASIRLLERRTVEARDTFARLGNSGLRLPGLAMAEHSLGHAAEARRLMDRAMATVADNSAYQIAQAWAWMGQRDAAFTWLERALHQMDGGLALLQFDAFFDSLRDDARYRELLVRLHFVPPRHAVSRAGEGPVIDPERQSIR
jgi:TolB-like protein/Flp pilus assembly protein TadD